MRLCWKVLGGGIRRFEGIGRYWKEMGSIIERNWEVWGGGIVLGSFGSIVSY